MINWHKKIKPNQVRDCIISGQDIMPTLAELANTKTPQQVTGTSFIPTLFLKIVHKDPISIGSFKV